MDADKGQKSNSKIEIKLDYQNELNESCDDIFLHGINYKGNDSVNQFEEELKMNVKNNSMDLLVCKNGGTCKQHIYAYTW